MFAILKLFIYLHNETLKRTDMKTQVSRTLNLFSKVDYKVYCTEKFKKFIYTNADGETLRTSKNEYAYACVAETVKVNGYQEGGRLFVVSFGNKRESVMRSMASVYWDCNLHVVEIEKK